MWLLWLSCWTLQLLGKIPSIPWTIISRSGLFSSVHRTLQFILVPASTKTIYTVGQVYRKVHNVYTGIVRVFDRNDFFAAVCRWTSFDCAVVQNETVNLLFFFFTLKFFFKCYRYLPLFAFGRLPFIFLARKRPLLVWK